MVELSEPKKKKITEDFRIKPAGTTEAENFGEANNIKTEDVGVVGTEGFIESKINPMWQTILRESPSNRK